MFQQPKLLTPVLTSALLAGAAAAALGAFSPSFQGAPAGAAVPFVHVALPTVSLQPGHVASPAPAKLNAFAPSASDLVSGEVVITSDRQMRYVWSLLFATQYDATLFDFNSTFVVLVGGGAQNVATFGIPAVETVDANYSGGFPLPGPIVDPFVVVTATLFIPGAYPEDPPPARFVVDAVKIPRALLDDVVFHRNVTGGI